MLSDISSMIYGAPNRQNLSVIDAFNNQTGANEHFNKFASEQFRTVIADTQYSLVSDYAIQRASMIAREAEASLDENSYIRRVTRENYHRVNNITKEYIMANPEIHDLYMKDMIEGYSPSGFVPSNAEIIDKVFDPYFTSVKTGIVSKDEDRIEHYYTKHENNLSGFDKFAIYDSWKNVIQAYNTDGEDLTDV